MPLRFQGGHFFAGDLRAMDPRDLSIEELTYELPPGHIAPHPLPDRDASRLLVVRGESMADHHFRDLPDLLPDNALLVMNDTRVVNARLLFERATGATVEVFCLEPDGGPPVEQALAQRGEAVWHCALGNARRWKEGVLEHVRATPQGEEVRLFAERMAPGEKSERVRFRWTPHELGFGEVLERMGEVPLPPYLDRSADATDTERYQTVYAHRSGSVAAPTAGLHFTPDLLQALERKGLERHRLTLHVGAGTFMPVRSHTMGGHAMHMERVQVRRTTVEALRNALGARPVVAVGTTTLRTLESLYWHGVAILAGADPEAVAVGQWEPYGHEAAHQPDAADALGAVLRWMDARALDEVQGATRLLIAPGYRVRTADALLTNFHQPRSTLLLLVAAFIGPHWREAYAHALDKGYRFLSYGDGSLLWRST